MMGLGRHEGDPLTEDVNSAGRTTGRYLVVIDDSLFGDDEASRQAVRDVTGVEEVRCTRGADDSALATAQAEPGESVLFAEVGVAVVTLAPARIGTASTLGAGDPRILAVEPERIVHALRSRRRPMEARTMEDAVEQESTWGLVATGVAAATGSGAGVTVAVLDTGFDLEHPDFAGREIESRSFVGGTPQDVQGHGTHTAGTATGPLDPAEGPRYGVAHGAKLMVGKVLDDDGSGTDSGILAGMSWAIAGGAQVLSMSLGADQRTVSTAYETVGRRALAAGTLIVAAAGNNADRVKGDPGFVGVPANSPSIMAVAAVDSALAVANFSASATDVAGGEIDIAGPGVEVYSTWPMPQRYETISGTSMATPHVAGIAVLWAEHAGVSGQALWDAVVGAARPLPLPAHDVGAGLAKAPAP